MKVIFEREIAYTSQMLEIDSTGLMIFGLTGKCTVFSQNWFEAVVEVVMEKQVPPAKLIPLLELVGSRILLRFKYSTQFKQRGK